MKLTLCVVSLISVAMAMFIADVSAVVNCKNIFVLPNNDTVYYNISTLRKYIHQQKCQYYCLLKDTEMVTKKGLIDVKRFMRFQRESELHDDQTLLYIGNIVDTCREHKHESGDECETVALFVECTNYVAPRHGIIDFRHIIQSAFWAEYDEIDENDLISDAGKRERKFRSQKKPHYISPRHLKWPPEVVKSILMNPRLG